MEITIKIEPPPENYSTPTWGPVYLPFDGILILVGSCWVFAADTLELGGSYYINCRKVKGGE
jgi:hypothetical protein